MDKWVESRANIYFPCFSSFLTICGYPKKITKKQVTCKMCFSFSQVFCSSSIFFVLETFICSNSSLVFWYSVRSFEVSASCLSLSPSKAAFSSWSESTSLEAARSCLWRLSICEECNIFGYYLLWHLNINGSKTKSINNTPFTISIHWLIQVFFSLHRYDKCND